MIQTGSVPREGETIGATTSRRLWECRWSRQIWSCQSASRRRHGRLPAGRLVDAIGTDNTMIAGLSGVVSGTAVLTVLPILLGAARYMSGLILTTAGYALFQAANNTGVMRRASADRKGVTSALLGLSRNLGLISGARSWERYSLLDRPKRYFGVGAGTRDRIAADLRHGLPARCCRPRRRRVSDEDWYPRAGSVSRLD